MKTLTTSLLTRWLKLLPAALLSASIVFTSCDKADVEPQKDNVSVTSSDNTIVKQASIPTIKCLSSTDHSITIEVKAGASGAPKGFTIQWKKDGEDWSKCQTKNYDICLKPYECKIICIENLDCGKCYVFRASTNAYTLDGCYYACSPYSCEIKCSTKPCPPKDLGCTHTQGYWKTHGPTPTGNNTNQWHTAGFKLGTTYYTAAQLQTILNTPVKGNGLISLAHQLIAAKLNIINGAYAGPISTVIAQADALINGQSILTGYLSPSSTSALTDALAKYNEGQSGVPSCD
ncbi:hypothetical protein [Hymenobacter tenuis]